MHKKDIEEWLAGGALMTTGRGRMWLGWGRRKWLAAPAADGRPSFYFPDFFLKQPKPWFVHQQALEVSCHELLQALAEMTMSRQGEAYAWHNAYRQLFADTFHQLQQKFVSGELVKAVPFVMETVPLTMSAPQLAASLIGVLNYVGANPAYAYGFWGEEEGLLGATPEILFRFPQPQQLETIACAGTTAICGDAAAFLSDAKILHEHQLVVQGIVESLSGYGQVSIGERQLLRLSRLAHLVTPITVALKTLPSFEEVVQAMHPTPALGAFPRPAGWCWLEQYQQKIGRQRFGAPVGVVDAASGLSNCYVAIRNVQWTKCQMSLAAGCGLVAASEHDAEWAEVALKLQATKEMLLL